LLRIDWLSGLIGALLCWLEAVGGRFANPALPGLLPGGAEVVRRIASRNLERIPMTKSKSRPKISSPPAARKLAKPTARKSALPSASRLTAARSDTKHARILAMLRAPAGATIAAIVAAMGWQQHSVRGFLAGVVRKKLGLNLVSEQTDKGRVYRIRDRKAATVVADRAKQAA
jgi:hypothetical protein